MRDLVGRLVVPAAGGRRTTRRLAPLPAPTPQIPRVNDEEWEPLDPWDPWQQGDQCPPDAPVLEVYVSDPPGPLGVILGPDGEPLHTVYDRDPLPFGFHP